MQRNNPTPLKPGSRAPAERRPVNLLAGLVALLAMIALGLALPRLAGHAHARIGDEPALSLHATAHTPSSAATWDPSVPPASDVFVDPESGTVITPRSPAL